MTTIVHDLVDCWEDACDDFFAFKIGAVFAVDVLHDGKIEWREALVMEGEGHKDLELAWLEVELVKNVKTMLNELCHVMVHRFGPFDGGDQNEVIVYLVGHSCRVVSDNLLERSWMHLLQKLVSK